jgi:hypothetical protein
MCVQVGGMGLYVQAKDEKSSVVGILMSEQESPYSFE